MTDAKMTREEREAFLADVHVGVLSVEAPERGPLALPIWYAYEPGGDLWVITTRGSQKGRLIEAAGRFSLCAQSEALPYRYVSVEGEVTAIVPCDVERDLRPMARRYLGDELGDVYVAQTAPGGDTGDTVVIRMRPRRWVTVDYAKQYGQG